MIVSALVLGYPTKYYLYFIHRHMYLKNSIELTFFASWFIYTYRVFYLTLMLEIIIYMYVPFICPYINSFNFTKYFISSRRSGGLLHTNFL